VLLSDSLPESLELSLLTSTISDSFDDFAATCLPNSFRLEGINSLATDCFCDRVTIAGVPAFGACFLVTNSLATLGFGRRLFLGIGLTCGSLRG